MMPRDVQFFVSLRLVFVEIPLGDHLKSISDFGRDAGPEKWISASFIIKQRNLIVLIFLLLLRIK